MGNLHEMFAYSVCNGVKRIQPKRCRKNKLTEPPDIGGLMLKNKAKKKNKHF